MSAKHTSEAGSGLVCGYVLDGEGGAESIDGETQTPRPQWLHLDYSAPMRRIGCGRAGSTRT